MADLKAQERHYDAERSRAYYLQNREKILARRRARRLEDPNFVARMAKRTAEWQEANKIRVRELQKAWKINNARKYKQRTLYTSAMRRASERAIEFTITPDDCLIPEVCPVFSVPFYFGEGRDDHSPSLDRIDNEKGYVKGNVIVVSELANRMKSNATLSQMVQLANFYMEMAKR